jgi:hypothetical protein
MEARTEQAIQSLLTSGTGLLPNLREKVSQLVHLNELLRTQLDSALAAHCCVANLKGSCLVIEVESSAWSLHLRYSIPELLKQLRKFPEFKQLQTIEWYIRPALETITEKVTVHRPPLSSENVELIHEMAEHVSNEKLKRALFKFAESAKK